MATITKESNSWVLTTTSGTAVGAGFNEATAELDANGTVMINGPLGAIWAGPIGSISGLTGGTPALLFINLVNAFLSNLIGAGTVNNIVAGTGIGVSGGTGPTTTISNTGIIAVNAAAGPGIGVSTSGGTATVSNTGILSVTGGTGISASTSSGAVSLGNTGVTGLVAGSGIAISSATGNVTVSNTGGSLGTSNGFNYGMTLNNTVFATSATNIAVYTSDGFQQYDNTGGAWNATTGIFTVPGGGTGYYRIYAVMQHQTGTLSGPTNSIQWSVSAGGVTFYFGATQFNPQCATMAVNMHLTVGQQVYIVADNTSSTDCGVLANVFSIERYA